MSMEMLREQFRLYKIREMQLDPYGVCNAKCWFCPVRYKGNPAHGKEVMSIELLTKIIENLMEERSRSDGLVDKNFGGFYTAHYNEILLYPHFEELLKLAKQHHLNFNILSNGVPLTPERVDLILKYDGVVNGICLNIPAFEADTWSKRSGINIKLFDKLISNVKYAMEMLPNMVQNKTFSIQVNGVNEKSFRGGWLSKGPEFPEDIDLNPYTGELSIQVQKGRELFPDMQIYPMNGLMDRAGELDHVLTNKIGIQYNLQRGDSAKRVIGCSNGMEVGGRPVGWLHVNAAGKVFLCCNDYEMEVVLGDFKTQTLREFWGSEYHLQKIQESYNSICRQCASAIFEQ